MTTATATRPAPKTARELLTADDLLALYADGVRGELIRGALSETMPAGHRHGKIVTRLVMRLGAFIEPQRLGTLTASDSGVWLERDPDTVREPQTSPSSPPRRFRLTRRSPATPKSPPTSWSRSSRRPTASPPSTTKR